MLKQFVTAAKCNFAISHPFLLGLRDTHTSVLCFGAVKNMPVFGANNQSHSQWLSSPAQVILLSYGVIRGIGEADQSHPSR